MKVSYAIGVARPISVALDCFGAERLPLARLEVLVQEFFDLRQGAILRDLDLRRPIYEQTSAYGQFGRSGDAFTWERTDRTDGLRAAVGSVSATVP